jgi:dipeptidyl aminopeptidase/acylaminoacyl peptidase
MLTMQPYIFVGPDESDFAQAQPPIKAAAADAYLVSRMSASESPNVFYTEDFKSFTTISSVYPERGYKWITSELVRWTTLDGRIAEGILYKPEDFDPNAKYPVIFSYYEKNSETLHLYHAPEADGATVNIPYLVSNGYLVFVPDIHLTIGNQGEGAYNAIVSAGLYFASMPWVRADKMGLQGHSRGGYETNYVVTHSHLFAAAMSSSGYCDQLSLYLGVNARGSPRSAGAEWGSQRIGATPWQRPDLYIASSPIFLADKVSTPLLMMNNREDDDIPFEQGLEWMIALRRLGKKAWLLQYDGGGHMLNTNSANAIDLTIRMQQFFDHYLKDTPPSKWMTEGLPARLKGVESGLELDTSGKEP